jgi:hypothetical protein
MGDVLERCGEVAQTLRLLRLNTLITGPSPQIDDILRLLRPLLDPPVEIRELPGGLDLPAAGQGTLVLREVARLEPAQQSDLLSWLEGRHPLVISATSSALFGLVQCGAFNERLYYRLAMVLEDLNQWAA